MSLERLKDIIYIDAYFLNGENKCDQKTTLTNSKKCKNYINTFILNILTGLYLEYRIRIVAYLYSCVFIPGFLYCSYSEYDMEFSKIRKICLVSTNIVCWAHKRIVF